MTSTFSTAADRLEKEFHQELADFIAFPSISPEPEHKDDCIACARYLQSRIARIGFETQLIETSGNPIVYGELIKGPDLPTVLVYGHYDVQKTGDPEKWKTKDPFKATLSDDGRIYARGAEDNKGQLTYVVRGIETVERMGLLKCNIKFLGEGEEEIGSKGLGEKLPEIAHLLKSDILLVCDTDAPELGRGGISLGLRGNAVVAFKLRGPKEDVHSGLWGGIGPNPISAMSKIISSFHNEDGSIAVEGFLDHVRPIDPKVEAILMKDAASDQKLLADSGWLALDGEAGFSAQLRGSLRPALDFTSVDGGEMGHNSIPAEVSARVVARLVADQDPKECLAQMKRHIEQRLPKGIQLDFLNERAGDWAFLDPKDPCVELAAEAVRRGTGAEPGFLFSGGSVPIVAPLRAASGAKPLLLGFGLPDDNIHNVNESMHTLQLRNGFITVCEFFAMLSEQGKI